MNLTPYARWIQDRDAIVSECGGWPEYLAIVERMIVVAKFKIPTSLPLYTRVADLAERWIELIAGLEAEVGEHVTYNHSTRYGNLVEVELSNGDSFLGYDLVDALEQAAESRKHRLPVEQHTPPAS